MSKVRREMAINNCVSRDRPEVAITARASPERRANSIDGTQYCLKRHIRDFASHPHGVLMCPGGLVDESLRTWADSGDVALRKSCSRGYSQRNGGDLPLEQDSGKRRSVFAGARS